ncbi:zinc ribbon domain-containing protein [Patulibacter sp.]|uniref:zinc ribbon domain-containing protein n=1 Tax=Patulibacter sp. TaxID=1912859 RepID=UPI002722393F|nr:zinc ribbon domain-containing protein [Patulibacter sp.]MDO9409259.1 zinc ribbon domain-containing protein [Patulibacter sp.]
MAGQAELFTVCSSCGQQVSTFVTECPYCGTRLQKRAPRLDRKDGDLEALLRLPSVEPDRSSHDRTPRGSEDDDNVVPLKRGRRTLKPRSKPDAGPKSKSKPSRPKPGGSGLRATLRRPRRAKSSYATEGKAYATFAIILISLIGLPVQQLLNGTDLLLIDGSPAWRAVTASLLFTNTWNAVAVLTTFGVFGWLWERRAGAVGSAVVVVAFLVAGVGGLLLDRAADPGVVAFGSAGAAIALATAWIVTEIRARRQGESLDGDLLGAATLLVVPIATTALTATAVPVSIGVGLVLGSLLGLGLSLARR